MKQAIVLRKDLGIRKGKMIAQGAHASLKVFLDQKDEEAYKNGAIHIPADKDIKQWIDGLYTKICLSCSSELELLELYDQAVQAGLPCALVKDAGLTEFNHVETNTCIAIGPAEPEKIDEITGHLKPL